MDSKIAAENLASVQRKASAAAVAQALADANAAISQNLVEISAKVVTDTSTDYAVALAAKQVALAAYWTNGAISAAAFNAASVVTAAALIAKTAAPAAFAAANADVAAKIQVAATAAAAANRTACDVVLALGVVEKMKSLREIAHRCGVEV